MSRFKPLGIFVYEDGNKIGCTPDEGCIELAKKLNAYQMRVERFKAEIIQLRKDNSNLKAAGDALGRQVLVSLFKGDGNIDLADAYDSWRDASIGKPVFKKTKKRDV